MEKLQVALRKARKEYNDLSGSDLVDKPAPSTPPRVRIAVPASHGTPPGAKVDPKQLEEYVQFLSRELRHAEQRLPRTSHGIRTRARHLSTRTPNCNTTQLRLASSATASSARKPGPGPARKPSLIPAPAATGPPVASTKVKKRQKRSPMVTFKSPSLASPRSPHRKGHLSGGDSPGSPWTSAIKEMGDPEHGRGMLRGVDLTDAGASMLRGVNLTGLHGADGVQRASNVRRDLNFASMPLHLASGGEGATAGQGITISSPPRAKDASNTVAFSPSTRQEYPERVAAERPSLAALMSRAVAAGIVRSRGLESPRPSPRHGNLPSHEETSTVSAERGGGERSPLRERGTPLAKGRAPGGLMMPDGRADYRPSDRPDGRADFRPYDRPGDQPDDRPDGRADFRPDDRPGDWPDDRPDDRHTRRTLEEVVEERLGALRRPHDTGGIVSAGIPEVASSPHANNNAATRVATTRASPRMENRRPGGQDSLLQRGPTGSTDPDSVRPRGLSVGDQRQGGGAGGFGPRPLLDEDSDEWRQRMQQQVPFSFRGSHQQGVGPRGAGNDSSHTSNGTSSSSSFYYYYSSSRSTVASLVEELTELRESILQTIVPRGIDGKRDVMGKDSFGQTHEPGGGEGDAGGTDGRIMGDAITDAYFHPDGPTRRDPPTSTAVSSPLGVSAGLTTGAATWHRHPSPPGSPALRREATDARGGGSDACVGDKGDRGGSVGAGGAVSPGAQGVPGDVTGVRADMATASVTTEGIPDGSMDSSPRQTHAVDATWREDTWRGGEHASSAMQSSGLVSASVSDPVSTSTGGTDAGSGNSGPLEGSSFLDGRDSVPGHEYYASREVDMRRGNTFMPGPAGGWRGESHAEAIPPRYGPIVTGPSLPISVPKPAWSDASIAPQVPTVGGAAMRAAMEALLHLPSAHPHQQRPLSPVAGGRFLGGTGGDVRVDTRELAGRSPGQATRGISRDARCDGDAAAQYYGDGVLRDARAAAQGVRVTPSKVSLHNPSSARGGGLAISGAGVAIMGAPLASPLRGDAAVQGNFGTSPGKLMPGRGSGRALGGSQAIGQQAGSGGLTSAPVTSPPRPLYPQAAQPGLVSGGQVSAAGDIRWQGKSPQGSVLKLPHGWSKGTNKAALNTASQPRAHLDSHLGASDGQGQPGYVTTQGAAVARSPPDRVVFKGSATAAAGANRSGMPVTPPGQRPRRRGKGVSSPSPIWRDPQDEVLGGDFLRSLHDSELFSTSDLGRSGFARTSGDLYTANGTMSADSLDTTTTTSSGGIRVSAPAHGGRQHPTAPSRGGIEDTTAPAYGGRRDVTAPRAYDGGRNASEPAYGSRRDASTATEAELSSDAATSQDGAGRDAHVPADARAGGSVYPAPRVPAETSREEERERGSLPADRSDQGGRPSLAQMAQRRPVRRKKDGGVEWRTTRGSQVKFARFAKEASHEGTVGYTLSNTGKKTSKGRQAHATAGALSFQGHTRAVARAREARGWESSRDEANDSQGGHDLEAPWRSDGDEGNEGNRGRPRGRVKELIRTRPAEGSDAAWGQPGEHRQGTVPQGTGQQGTGQQGTVQQNTAQPNLAGGRAGATLVLGNADVLGTVASPGHRSAAAPAHVPASTGPSAQVSVAQAADGRPAEGVGARQPSGAAVGAGAAQQAQGPACTEARLGGTGWVGHDGDGGSTRGESAGDGGVGQVQDGGRGGGGVSAQVAWEVEKLHRDVTELQYKLAFLEADREQGELAQGLRDQEWQRFSLLQQVSNLRREQRLLHNKQREQQATMSALKHAATSAQGSSSAPGPAPAFSASRAAQVAYVGLRSSSKDAALKGLSQPTQPSNQASVEARQSAQCAKPKISEAAQRLIKDLEGKGVVEPARAVNNQHPSPARTNQGGDARKGHDLLEPYTLQVPQRPGDEAASGQPQGSSWHDPSLLFDVRVKRAGAPHPGESAFPSKKKAQRAFRSGRLVQSDTEERPSSTRPRSAPPHRISWDKVASFDRLRGPRSARRREECLECLGALSSGLSSAYCVQHGTKL
eukprot:jgi/Mesvir1/24831/Mv22071-RA.1